MKVWFYGFSLLVCFFLLWCSKVPATISKSSNILSSDTKVVANRTIPQLALSYHEKEVWDQKGWQERYTISWWNLRFSAPLGCDENTLDKRFFEKHQELNYFLSGNRVYQYMKAINGTEVFDRTRASFEYLEYFPNTEKKNLQDFNNEWYELLSWCWWYTNIKDCEDLLVLHKNWEEWSYLLKQWEIPYYFYFDGGWAWDACSFAYTFDEIIFFDNH